MGTRRRYIIRNNVKFLVACLLVIAAGVFLYVRYRHVKPAARDLIPKPVVSPSTPGGAGNIPSVAPEASPGRLFPAGSTAGLPPGSSLRPPGAEERRQIREEILTGLNLTDEQRKQIGAVFEKEGDEIDPEKVRQRMIAIGRLLTPEQREAAAGMMRQRLLSRINDGLKMLPAEEREKFMQKLDARFEQRRREMENTITAPTPP